MPPGLRIFLYNEPLAATLDVRELQRWLQASLGAPVEVRPSLALVNEGERARALDGLALDFARAKVRNPAQRDYSFEPLPGEIAYEHRRLSGESNAFGLLYDAEFLVTALRRHIPAGERGLSDAHVVFTSQLVGTWETSDRRYHARVSVYSMPSLISTTGVVEAPAKPREFYLLKRQYAALGMDDAAVMELERRYEGRFIAHDDPRMTEVVKGYAAQAVMHALTGEPFCAQKSCRLYNAHWQEELIAAQLTSPDLCPEHERSFAHLAQATEEGL
jgi:hypothetical protein